MKKIDCLTMGKMVEEMFDGEPVFILRAHDVAAVEALKAYRAASRVANGGNLIRTDAAIQRFESWQHTHPNEVRPAD